MYTLRSFNANSVRTCNHWHYDIAARRTFFFFFEKRCILQLAMSRYLQNKCLVAGDSQGSAKFANEVDDIACR